MSGKTGTTEAHRSSAFLGYTNNLAAAVYAYNDGPLPSELCSGPLRQCGYGNLYGGSEPARTWFAAIGPVAGNFGPTFLPPNPPEYVGGTPRGRPGRSACAHASPEPPAPSAERRSQRSPNYLALAQVSER